MNKGKKEYTEQFKFLLEFFSSNEHGRATMRMTERHTRSFFIIIWIIDCRWALRREFYPQMRSIYEVRRTTSVHEKFTNVWENKPSNRSVCLKYTLQGESSVVMFSPKMQCPNWGCQTFVTSPLSTISTVKFSYVGCLVDLKSIRAEKKANLMISAHVFHPKKIVAFFRLFASHCEIKWIFSRRPAHDSHDLTVLKTRNGKQLACMCWW